ncbi:MAG TPA: exodeoxyribonuclease VII small subunit [Henriciella marina]|jgi:exodeoxyribonuclease VII small subunit|uniref:Exodeoxyribonuclease 7 small subunit n=1 Tax=Henriciella algicola TaxID=1608422 RepID=A0A399RH62_9PROT|nr:MULTISPECIES: exodeoxyribonuclease VII small subunit [Henriciella]QYJ00099.1 exodeoxyribonuclease VII small subunit [Thalassovita mediterranea]RIJ29165.1 exodeoxyribonuclease VII small subunit [Henriciella algicola]HIG22874.1 exodeoxyribonuclease VII small subunit [Henriciella sp.]HIK65861.1 exodeoxyribonuclease VII small subunit [Henriciella marina]
MSDQTVTDIEKMSFEQALRELETIVRQLEGGEVELEKSIEIYERGAKLKSHCEARLKAAELKIEQIVQGPDGKPTTESASFE